MVGGETTCVDRANVGTAQVSKVTVSPAGANSRQEINGGIGDLIITTGKALVMRGARAVCPVRNWDSVNKTGRCYSWWEELPQDLGA